MNLEGACLMETGNMSALYKIIRKHASNLKDKQPPSEVSIALYQEVGEKGSEMENVEFQKGRMDALQQKLVDAHSSIHHIELIDTVKINVQQFHEVDRNRSTMDPPMSVNLDIPESVGLPAPMPGHSTSRLVDIDLGNIGRRGKRRM